MSKKTALHLKLPSRIGFLLFLIKIFVVSIASQPDYLFCREPIEKADYSSLYASDNVNIFLATNNDKILSINKKNFNLNWTSEPGGEIVQIATDGQKVFVLTKITAKEIQETVENKILSNKNSEYPEASKKLERSERSERSEVGLKKETVLRILNSDNGLPLKTAVAEGFNQSHLKAIYLPDDRIILIAENKRIFSFDRQFKEIRQTSIADNPPTAKNGAENFLETAALMNVSMTDVDLYLAAGKSIYAVEIKTGTVYKKITSGKEISSFLINSDENLVYGDFSGKITSYNLLKNRIDWQFRTGGEVISLLKSDKGIFAASVDNFLYKLGEKGQVIWKHRFNYRPENILFDKGFLFVNNQTDKRLEIISVKNGRSAGVLPYPEPENRLELMVNKTILNEENNEGIIFKGENSLYQLKSSGCLK